MIDDDFSEVDSARQTFLVEEARASIKLLKQIGSRFVVLLITYDFAGNVLDVMAEEGMLGPAWQIVASETIQDFILERRPVGFMYFLPSGEGAKFPELQQLWSLLGPEDMFGTNHLAGPTSVVIDEIFAPGEVLVTTAGNSARKYELLAPESKGRHARRSCILYGRS